MKDCHPKKKNPGHMIWLNQPDEEKELFGDVDEGPVLHPMQEVYARASVVD